MTGHTIFNADKANVLTNCETKIVSTIVYSPINNIITIVGNAKCNSDEKVKSFAKGLFIIRFLLFGKS